MEVELESQEEAICGLPISFFHLVMKHTLEEAKLDFLKSKHIIASIVAVSDKEIQRLNREHRGKDAITDILSFGMYDGMKDLEKEKGHSINIGELVLNCPYLERAAKEDGVSKERECVFMVSHGFLHLLGFEHGEKMFSLQDEVCDTMEKEK